MDAQVLEQVKTYAVIAVPIVVAGSQWFLARRAANTERARKAAADKGEKDRGDAAKVLADQTAILNEIKGSVGDHGTKIAVLTIRVDGHDRELGRLNRGAYLGADRRGDAGQE